MEYAAKEKQEALFFVGKKGPNYVIRFATKEEKRYFEGNIYHNGIPDVPLISSIASPANF